MKPPEQLKLFNFAKKEVSLSGLYQISDFPKISEIASNKKDNVKVDLSFYLKNNKNSVFFLSKYCFKYNFSYFIYIIK